jgi:hypothetical protein
LTVQPVWAVAPESVIVSPAPDEQLELGKQVDVWGRAWAATGVESVEVSVDAGQTWQLATVEPRQQWSWRFDPHGAIGSHRSRRMMEWVASKRDWLSIEPLPGYAPDLNPTEQVWGSVKSKELANLCADTTVEVAEAAEDGLDRISDDAPLRIAFLHHTGLRL